MVYGVMEYGVNSPLLDGANSFFTMGKKIDMRVYSRGFSYRSTLIEENPDYVSKVSLNDFSQLWVFYVSNPSRYLFVICFDLFVVSCDLL